MFDTTNTFILKMLQIPTFDTSGCSSPLNLDWDGADDTSSHERMTWYIPNLDMYILYSSVWQTI